MAAEAADEHFLHAIVGQASVALDNCRLFSRIYQANRHWLEIFDAIEDLIVVHDEGNRVLRVNRSLADSIGARPPELIGISIDRKSTRLNSSHLGISYAVFCLKKNMTNNGK